MYAVDIHVFANYSRLINLFRLTNVAVEFLLFINIKFGRKIYSFIKGYLFLDFSFEIIILKIQIFARDFTLI